MSPLLSRRDLLAAGSGACGAIALLGLSAKQMAASDDQENAGRRLLRTGQLEYHPMGAPAVRVLFDRGDIVSKLTIVDAALTVVAQRVT